MGLLVFVSTAWAQPPGLPHAGRSGLPARLGGPDGPIDRSTCDTHALAGDLMVAPSFSKPRT